MFNGYRDYTAMYRDFYLLFAWFGRVVGVALLVAWFIVYSIAYVLCGKTFAVSPRTLFYTILRKLR